MPDFQVQPSFPMAAVISAAQKKGQLENETTMKQSELFNQSLQAIGQVGSSLLDQKKKIAQSLALGKQFGVPDELSKTMEPEQLLKLGTIQKGNIDMANVMAMLAKMQPAGGAGAAAASSAPAVAAPAAATPTAAPANGAILASNVTATPIPETSPMQPGLTPPATGQASIPVPVPAPPVTPAATATPTGATSKPMNPATFSAMLKLHGMTAPQAVMSDEDAIKAGSVPHGTRIVHQSPSTANTTWDTATDSQKSLAKAVYEGRVRPSDIGFKERGKMVMLANDYAGQSGLPPFKAYAGDINAAMGKYATTGKMGQNALSLNTALGHASSAYDSYQALGNTNQAWLNTPINKLRKETKDPNVVALGINLNALQGELANVFKNSGATDQEISHWHDYLNEDLTPDQYVGALGKIDELLRSRIDALDYQRSQAGGGAGGSLLSPHAKEISTTLGNLKQSQPGAQTGTWTPDKEQRYQELLDKRAGKKSVSM